MSHLLIKHALAAFFLGYLNTLPVMRDYPNSTTYFVQWGCLHGGPFLSTCLGWGQTCPQPRKLYCSEVRDETDHCIAVMTGVKAHAV